MYVLDTATKVSSGKLLASRGLGVGGADDEMGRDKNL